jgi:Holliday junction resolvase
MRRGGELEIVKEVDVARAVVRWLEDRDWTVYQEVSLGYAEPTLDLVAKRGPVLWIVECKASMSLALLEQAARSIGFAHLVSVAAPQLQPVRWRHRSPACHFVDRALEALGVGRFAARREAVGYDIHRRGAIYEWSADLLVRPRLNRRIVKGFIANRLNEAQRTYAPAGNAEGRRWSPFRETCDKVKLYVEGHPGCTMKEVIDAVDHHYAKDATARSSMAHWIKAGKVDGVEIRLEGRRFALYPIGNRRGLGRRPAAEVEA